jgi:hypothetical protein
VRAFPQARAVAGCYNNKEKVILENRTYTKIPPPLEKKVVLNFEVCEPVSIARCQMFAWFLSEGLRDYNSTVSVQY